MLDGSVTEMLKSNRLPLIAFIGIWDASPSVDPSRMADAPPALSPWSQCTVNVTASPGVTVLGEAEAVLE
jgi:hypothetical protein